MTSARTRHPTRLAELALWTVGFVGGATAAAVWHASPAPAAAAVLPGVVPPAPAAPRADTGALGAAVALLAEQDPFRVTHRPALVAFGAPPRPVLPAAAPPPSFAPPRPRLLLLGIIGGAGGWAAVLAGVAGRDGGALVRAGDTLGGLHVRRVTRDSLVVQGRDTLWRLTLGAGARP